MDSLVLVESPNDVDKTKEVYFDPRALLQSGDTVTVNYLLDLMITRSDNTAANCLIDLARRENINILINNYKWNGSEVTRKFLNRSYEDPGYKDIRGTETCAGLFFQYSGVIPPSLISIDFFSTGLFNSFLPTRVNFRTITLPLFVAIFSVSMSCFFSNEFFNSLPFFLLLLKLYDVAVMHLKVA